MKKCIITCADGDLLVVALVEHGDHFELVPEGGERLVEASPGDARPLALDRHVARLGADGGRKVGAVAVVMAIEAAREAARLQPPHLHAAAQVVGGRGQAGVGRHVQVPLTRPLVTSAKIVPKNTQHVKINVHHQSLLIHMPYFMGHRNFST